MDDDDSGGFLSRWARRKAEGARGGAVGVVPEAVPIAMTPIAAPVEQTTPAAEPPPPPLPTLADVALLTRESDYSRFVAAGVDEGVKRAAMKKLFADPHFNVMDGLDTYIADYGVPDPIPLAMLRQMNQSKFLRLFDDDEEDDATKEKEPDRSSATATIPAPEPATTAPDDDPDLRLQQDDAAGRPGPGEGARA